MDDHRNSWKKFKYQVRKWCSPASDVFLMTSTLAIEFMKCFRVLRHNVWIDSISMHVKQQEISVHDVTITFILCYDDRMLISAYPLLVCMLNIFCISPKILQYSLQEKWERRAKGLQMWMWYKENIIHSLTQSRIDNQAEKLLKT